MASVDCTQATIAPCWQAPLKERIVDRSSARALGARCAVSMVDRSIEGLSQDSGPIDVIDMFSGCGGMSTGFLALNSLVPSYRLQCAIDIDSVASATYAANLGLQPVHVDIAHALEDQETMELLQTTGNPRVLIGCAPCQGFSSHRNSAGDSDVRNSLLLDFAEIAARLKPEAILSENVPEILTDRYWPYVESVRETLTDAGYFVHVGVHNMASFGVPQQRFRALIMAMRRPFEPPRGFLTANEFRTVREAIAQLPRVEAGERLGRDELHYSARHKLSTLEVIRAVPKNGGNRPEGVGPDCLARVKARQGKAGYEDVYGRLAWDKPAITITAFARNPASGRFVHPDQDRGLTIREAALLQGFPQDYRFCGSLDAAFRQIGNAVPPVFSAYLAAHLLGELLYPADPLAAFDEGLHAPLGPSFSRLIPSLKAGTSNRLD